MKVSNNTLNELVMPLCFPTDIENENSSIVLTRELDGSEVIAEVVTYDENACRGLAYVSFTIPENTPAGRYSLLFSRQFKYRTLCLIQ